MTWLFLFWTIALNLQLTNARHVSFAPGDSCRVWAEEGARATLPCDLSPQKLASSRRQLYKGLSVHWVRHEGSSYKKRRMVLKVEPSGLKKLARSVMHRATVWDTGFLSGNFSLQIEPLLKDDAGTYEAWVKFGSEVWRCQLELGVVSVTANPPGPLVESEAIRLTCNSTRPETPTETNWVHAGLLIPNSGRFSSLDQSLFISRSVKSDSGPWACELIFADGERISATYNLQVIGFAEPTISVVYAAAGSNTYLPCVLNHGPISRLAVHWSYMTRRKSKAKLTPTRGNSRDFTLHLPAVVPDDAGQYLCEISIRSTTITKNVTLAVMTVTQAVTEESHLLLICNLSYHTGNEHFQWKHLGLMPTNRPWPEVTSRSFAGLSQGSTLEFSQVLPNDAGTWECSVHGPNGMLGSVQHHLKTRRPSGTSAQIASLQPAKTEKIIFGLIIFLLVLVVSVFVFIRLRKKISPTNFPALDRMVAAALPGKGIKDGVQEEKALQTEC
ncbi:lymphocyte activation gene 3 protein [Elgaria multicarinata webbii]|uniref:lymphocyte activation gene 3 protein n=1 Tax=Elgaria multicarinata webbii TaxID=159646 RepID=UPI002FCD0379